MEPMDPKLHDLPIEQRIRLVEELWDSIAAEQQLLPLTNAQQCELERRLEAYAKDGDKGRAAEEAITEIRKRL